MVKLVFCVRRRPDMDEAEFHRYWRDEHGPLVTTVASVLGIRRYVQTHTRAGPVSDALAASRGAPPGYDGVAEIWFDSEESIGAPADAAAAAAAAGLLLADERRFIDHATSPIFLAEEHAVI